jgi:hypothetical protein
MQAGCARLPYCCLPVHPALPRHRREGGALGLPRRLRQSAQAAAAARGPCSVEKVGIMFGTSSSVWDDGLRQFLGAQRCCVACIAVCAVVAAVCESEA